MSASVEIGVPASAIRFGAPPQRARAEDGNRMTPFAVALWRPVIASYLVCGVMWAASLGGDLSKYRNFQLGTDLATIAKQSGANPSQAKVIHRRPALIQDLAWRPQPLGASSQAESAQEVIFSFYNGTLYRIAVNYDRYATEGLTAEDIVERISASYGPATKPPAAAKAPEGYGDRDDVLAQWQDSQYSFDLIRSSYGPTFKLVGVLKSLEAPVQAAILESARLDDKEAPQREADRVAKDDETERARLEKARLVNKPKFRP